MRSEAGSTDGRGAWLAWPLLVLSALPLAAIALVARRVLTGRTSLLGEVPSDLALRERAGLLLNIVGTDGQLIAPLAGLAVLGWLARSGGRYRPPRPALWLGAGLAGAAALLALAQCALVGYLLLADPPEGVEVGFFGGRESLLEIYGPRTASAALLAVLGLALAAGLAAAARRTPPVEGELLDEQAVPHAEPASVEATEADLEEADRAAGDPHALYRRPS